MDRRSVIVLLVSFLLLMVWYPLTTRLFPPTPSREGTNSLSWVTNQIGTNVSTVSNPVPAMVTPPVATPPSLRTTLPSAPEETATIENDTARYIFSSHFGGLKLVELKKYQATVACDRKDKSATNGWATRTLRRRFPRCPF